MEIVINSKKFGIKSVFVDDSDFYIIKFKKWHLHKGPRTFYAATSEYREGKKRIVLMHKMLTRNIGMIDHKDGDGLNNRRNNLRSCSKLENNRNCRASKNNQIGLKGVSFSEERKKFEAKICVNYKTIHLGRYTTKEEAAAAYNSAAVMYFGDFARIN